MNKEIFKCELCNENKAPSRQRYCKDCQQEQPEHSCPYLEEIEGDCETLCTCSKAEEYQCAMDI